MELVYDLDDTFAPSMVEDFDFLDSLLYAKESWFALDWERPLPSTTPMMMSQHLQHHTMMSQHLQHHTMMSQHHQHHNSHPQQQFFNPVVPHVVAPRNLPADTALRQPVVKPKRSETPPNATSLLFAVQYPLEAKRSESATSIETSPDNRRARTLPKPISPKPSELRRLRTFSSSDSSSGDDSSDDGVRKSKKRSRSGVALVAHTSVFRGVSCCGKDRKFQARIRDGSKVHYLGRFDNEFDAAIKYDEAARSHKGDSATPNFVELTPQETLQLRAHYFASSRQILPEFYRFLQEATVERLEMRRTSKRTNRSSGEE